MDGDSLDPDANTCILNNDIYSAYLHTEGVQVCLFVSILSRRVSNPCRFQRGIFAPAVVTSPCNTASITAGNVPSQEQKSPSETSLEPRKDDF